MAKIAGRKNQGAWQRTNKAMLQADDSVQTALVTALAGSQPINDAFNKIVLYSGSFGLQSEFDYPTVTDWCDTLVETGIPLDIWLGKASYDTYVLKPGSNPPVYQPQLTPVLEKAAIQIRKICKQQLFAARQIQWLSVLNTPQPALTRRGVINAEREKKRLTAAAELSKLPVRRPRKSA